MTLLELRGKVQVTRSAYNAGQVPIEEMYAAADAYLAALKEWNRGRKGRKLPIPSRAYLLRAL